MDSPQKNIHQLNRLKALSSLLDTKFQGPFGIRFGLDGLIGLFPVFGDLSTTLASIYILIQAANMGCPTSVILRMALNIGIDNVFSAVPFFGNIFDFFWKSNHRNVILVEKYLKNSKSEQAKSRLILISVVLVLGGIMLLTSYLTYLLLSFLIGLF
jgi:uncharacterized membrane protein YwzB